MRGVPGSQAPLESHAQPVQAIMAADEGGSLSVYNEGCRQSDSSTLLSVSRKKRYTCLMQVERDVHRVQYVKRTPPGGACKARKLPVIDLDKLQYVGGSDVVELWPETSPVSLARAKDLSERVASRGGPSRWQHVPALGRAWRRTHPPRGTCEFRWAWRWRTTLKLYLGLVWIYGDPSRPIEDIPALTMGRAAGPRGPAEVG